MIASVLKKIFHAEGSLAEDARAAYRRVVEQSRAPRFYAQFGVADTVDGRFDVIVLHLFLIIHRLRRETSQDAAGFIRALTETFFADMDRSLREMGVGDTGVGKRIKNMAAAFYGRLQAYEQAAASGQWGDTLSRNLYRDAAPVTASLDMVAHYVQENIARLDAQSAGDIISAHISFLS